MNTLATNIVSLVIFPSIIVTGFLYATHRSLGYTIDSRPISAKSSALIAIGIGAYFLGHPHYPALVPLINAFTSWMFAIGGVYVTLGLISFVFTRHELARYERFCAVGSWVATIPAIVIGVLAANGFEFESVVRLLGPNSHNFEHSLYISIPLAFMFPFGYDSALGHRDRAVLALFLVFVSYAVALANSFPIMDQVRGPLAIMFIAFGCVGVLLGIPLYVLGNALASSPTDR